MHTRCHDARRPCIEIDQGCRPFEAKFSPNSDVIFVPGMTNGNIRRALNSHRNRFGQIGQDNERLPCNCRTIKRQCQASRIIAVYAKRSQPRECIVYLAYQKSILSRPIGSALADSAESRTIETVSPNVPVPRTGIGPQQNAYN